MHEWRHEWRRRGLEMVIRMARGRPVLWAGLVVAGVSVGHLVAKVLLWLVG